MRIVSALRTAYLWVGLVFITILGGWIHARPGWGSGYRGAATRLVLMLVRYVVTWVLAGLLLWWIHPTAFVGSRTGLQTALQVLPAVVVAVFVLILGSVAVVAQMASATWGTRAPVLLTMDDRFQQLVLRPVVLLIAVLLLAGQVPDAPSDPAEAVTAAAGALALATAVLTARATYVPAFVIRTIAPRNFPQFVIEDTWRELCDGSTELVVLRVGILDEMLKMSLRREDSVSLWMSLEAGSHLVDTYLECLEAQPGIRTHTVDDGSRREDWLAEDLTRSLVGPPSTPWGATRPPTTRIRSAGPSDGSRAASSRRVKTQPPSRRSTDSGSSARVPTRSPLEVRSTGTGRPQSF